MLQVDTIVKTKLKKTHIACVKDKQLPISELLDTKYLRHN